MSALATWSAQVSAEAFGECPTEAFLIQDKVANLYGVQLATGYYQKESPHDWGEAKMNALAFNIHDRYLYAYNYYYGTIVTIDAQLAVSPLWLTGLSVLICAGTSFFILISATFYFELALGSCLF